MLGLVVSSASATTDGGVVNDACPPSPAGATCGHVDVPLDRANPAAGTLPIAFQLYRHTGQRPAKSAVVVDTGFALAGTTIGSREKLVPLFASVRARHDIVLVDPRGRGRSGAIDCPALQHGTAPSTEAASACAEQLGDAAQRYGLGDIAKDIDAVRAALGYEKIDYYGLSYGGGDIAAYATRFGEHLRSIVIDAPWGPPQQEADKVGRDAAKAQALLRRVDVVCKGSTNCSSLQPDPGKRMRELVRRLRRTPLTGTARDAEGTEHKVRIDPGFLINRVMQAQPAPFINSGELAAAADALRNGDDAPLLRLAAENDPPVLSDSGEPTGFSYGGFAATFCIENRYPWSPGASLSDRLQQWDATVNAAPDPPFAPFRAAEVLRNELDAYNVCMGWPGPTTATLTVEPGAHYPRVPALVLGGDLDTVTPDSVREMADLFPGSTHVSVAGAGHGALLDSPCAVALAAEMIATLKVTDTSCAATSPKVYPGVGRFPQTAADSPPATASSGGGSATESDLRVTRVAVDTAVDALKRSMSGSGERDGVGLRGGTFHTEYGTPAWTTTLKGARYARDVAIDGTIHWTPNGPAEGALEAELTIDGPGQHDGTVQVTGAWLAQGSAKPLSIEGTLGGRTVKATVPSA
jgi:pimeloyl-ACP methyl ester carboxylesterase